VYAAGSDKSIREIEQSTVSGTKNGELSANGKELVRYDESIMYS